MLDRLKAGITIDGVHYGPIEAKLERVQGGNAWLLSACARARTAKSRRCASISGSRSTG